MKKSIDNNEEALNCMNNLLPSLENRVRSIYNMGYRKGYSDAVAEATKRLHEKVMDMLGEEENDEND